MSAPPDPPRHCFQTILNTQHQTHSPIPCHCCGQLIECGHDHIVELYTVDGTQQLNIRHKDLGVCMGLYAQAQQDIHIQREAA